MYFNLLIVVVLVEHILLGPGICQNVIAHIQINTALYIRMSSIEHTFRGVYALSDFTLHFTVCVYIKLLQIYKFSDIGCNIWW